jgi:hypothetical protein
LSTPHAGGSPHLYGQGWSCNKPRTAPSSSLHYTEGDVASATAALAAVVAAAVLGSAAAAALGSAACESTSAVIGTSAAFCVSVVAAAVVAVAGHSHWHWGEACTSLPRQHSWPLTFLPLRVSQALAQHTGKGLAAGLIHTQRCWHNRDVG